MKSLLSLNLSLFLFTIAHECINFATVNVADGDSQEFQGVSRPVSWDKDYLTGS